jgi:hypothetical protein
MRCRNDGVRLGTEIMTRMSRIINRTPAMITHTNRRSGAFDVPRQQIENLVVEPLFLGLTEGVGRIMSNLPPGICSSRPFATIERDMGSTSSGSTVTALSSDSLPIDIVTIHGPDPRVRGVEGV